MRTKLIGAAAVAAAIFGLWIYFSPYWAIAGLARAAIEGDTLIVSEYLNVPTLRESVRAEVMDGTLDTLDSGDAFSQIGGALGVLMADRLIDSIISPAGIARMMRVKLGSDLQAGSSPSRIKIAIRLVSRDDVYHDGLSLVHLGTHEHYITFQRTWMTWRMAAITANDP